jgi:hypothetical protein
MHTARLLPRRLLVFLAVLAIAIAAGGSGAAAATPPHQLRGVTLSPAWFAVSRNETAHELDAARRLGAGITRITAPWALIEPSAAGQRDATFVSKLDWVLRAARKRHLRVDLGIGGTPCWAVAEAGCKIASLAPPADPATFAAHATWIARRYGRLLTTVEIGNEPNNAAFFKGTASDYARMAAAGYRAIKAAAPRVTVATPALAFSDVHWMRQFYAAGGARIGDVVSVHPYSLSFGGEQPGFRGPLDVRSGDDAQYGFRSGLVALRALMQQQGDRRPVWLTEFGYASCAARPYCADDPRASDWMVQAFRWAASQRWIGAAMSFTLRDEAAPLPGQADWDTKFGLLRHNFTLKPQATAVEHLWHKLAAKAA